MAPISQRLVDSLAVSPSLSCPWPELPATLPSSPPESPSSWANSGCQMALLALGLCDGSRRQAITKPVGKGVWQTALQQHQGCKALVRTPLEGLLQGKELKFCCSVGNTLSSCRCLVGSCMPSMSLQWISKGTSLPRRAEGSLGSCITWQQQVPCMQILAWGTWNLCGNGQNHHSCLLPCQCETNVW